MDTDQVLVSLLGTAAAAPSHTKSGSGDISGGSGDEGVAAAAEQEPEHGKKRLGRKPAQTEPASKRIAQNRAAQRAYREKKENRMRELEAQAAAASAVEAENAQLKATVAALVAENTALRSVALFTFHPSNLQQRPTLPQLPIQPAKPPPPMSFGLESPDSLALMRTTPSSDTDSIFASASSSLPSLDVSSIIAPFPSFNQHDFGTFRDTSLDSFLFDTLQENEDELEKLLASVSSENNSNVTSDTCLGPTNNNYNEAVPIISPTEEINPMAALTSALSAKPWRETAPQDLAGEMERLEANLKQVQKLDPHVMDLLCNMFAEVALENKLCQERDMTCPLDLTEVKTFLVNSCGAGEVQGDGLKVLNAIQETCERLGEMEAKGEVSWLK
ncbi:hypothetical protein BC830DRAFT_1230374 [Chytriomyces sp. MP71]|nr:hypothetical protein BC830DRAFT_1230374 [Chytriomyces sp. MP71]